VYRIGTVARLAQVSIRTLRHYDEIGLLHPTRVDPDTGYRWYAPVDMARLHRILALRDLGVSLAEIGTLLDQDVTPEQLRGILLLRRAEARERIAVEQQRLARVEARIEQLEEPDMRSYDIGVKRLEALRLVVTHEDVADLAGVEPALRRMIPRVHAALAARGVAPCGPSYAVYDELADDGERVTFALPVADDVTISRAGVDTVVLVAGHAAAVVVRGAPESQFGDGFAALEHWATSTGQPLSAQKREVYLDCDGPRDTWVTELQAVLAEDQATPTNPANAA
jgi:DNA-binding transcriptional MerR regulator